MQKIDFYKAFPLFTAPFECLAKAEVVSCVIDQNTRVMNLTLYFYIYPPRPVIMDIESRLATLYGLSMVNITADFDKSVEIPKPPAPSPKPAGEKSAKTKPLYNGPKLNRIDGEVIFGKNRADAPIPLSRAADESGFATVRGQVFTCNHRQVRQGQTTVISFDITDYTGSIRVTKLVDTDKADPIIKEIKEGMWLTVFGRIDYSPFEKDTIMNASNVIKAKEPSRQDNYPDKRVELHLHTNMSALDAISDTKALVKQAIKWGHKAVAITDHGVVCAFPDAMSAAGDKIKVIYGLEAYFLNDLKIPRPVVGGKDQPMDGEFICFDLETTGLNPEVDRIIQIAAVKVKEGRVIDSFSTYVNPNRDIPPRIIELTGITDMEVKDAPLLDQAMAQFLDFAGEHIWVAHNAMFDMSFVNAACSELGIERDFTCIDTLIMARALLPDMSKHNLGVLAETLGAPSFKHHNALGDATALATVAHRLFKMLEDSKKTAKVSTINMDIAEIIFETKNTKGFQTYHMIILAKNQTGLRNMYKLVSEAHLRHFKRVPIIPRSLLDQHREGLIIGSACEAGELFSAMLEHKTFDELRNIADYYDYLEIQPICNNQFLVDKEQVADKDGLRELNKTIVKIAHSLKKPFVATGDVHFLDPTDEIYRRILIDLKFSDADRELPLYFKTTDEMMTEFSYLGDQDCRAAVIENPSLIADMCEAIRPVPEGTYPPFLDNAAEELEAMARARAAQLYGQQLPELIRARMERELHAIIDNGFAVLYMIAQKLVAKSLECGYLVGSRGSVGSSFVAFLAGITEVNALPPHYRCEHCVVTEFADASKYALGADLPDKSCACGRPYIKDGFDIRFETFMGFDGDKSPDIDLNFSGEYQDRAHKHTIELFGESHVFRAGTIGTIKDKTAFGYVSKYMEKRDIAVTAAEKNRLTKGCTGVKRTTGQHPGGLIVVPQDMEIYDFCPIQRPADKSDSDIITTHFDFHSIHDTLLKLDLLGHDDPSMIKLLEELTGVDAKNIPLDDPKTMSLFTGTGSLNLVRDIDIGEIGSIAVPEFGTKFVREMLKDTRPTTFDELIRISGLSHGENVWAGNSQDLVKDNVATLKGIICARDDITDTLVHAGLEPKLAFTISESVRKGRGLTPQWQEEMQAKNVPEWYIESCKKIKYLFPKAHASAYVMMAFRIAYFKVHHPLAFYCAYFSVRATSLNAEFMFRGPSVAKAKMEEIAANKDAKQAEQDMLTTLEVCMEFYARGFEFEKIDLYRSHHSKFLISPNALLPPFTCVPSVGERAALDIISQREQGRFLSVDELQNRCPRVSKSVIELLEQAGVFDEIPKTSQISFF